jgi:hypothetical protein
LRDPYVLDYEKRIQKSLQALHQEALLFTRLQKLVPKYFGVVSQQATLPAKPVSSGGKKSLDAYLLLENITIKFAHPCVIDVKVGAQSYEPDATDEKRLRECRKYPAQSEFGFRIVGMRIYDPSHVRASDDGFVFYDKEFGRSLGTREEVKEAFVSFFGAGTTLGSTSSVVRSSSISNILAHLRSIQPWFLDNKSFCFCASSLLVVYEGNSEASQNPDLVNVKMIDFGRVRRQAGGDRGYLRGLNTLIELFEEILEEGMHSSTT